MRAVAEGDDEDWEMKSMTRATILMGMLVFAAGVLGQSQAESASFAFLIHALNVSTTIILGFIGLFSTGATFRQVVASAQSFMKRDTISIE